MSADIVPPRDVAVEGRQGPFATYYRAVDRRVAPAKLTTLVSFWMDIKQYATERSGTT